MPPDWKLFNNYVNLNCSRSLIDFDKDLGDDDDDDYDDDDANFTLTPRMVRHSVVETYDNDDHFDLVYIVFVWVSLTMY